MSSLTLCPSYQYFCRHRLLRDGGFTYIGLLILMAIIALVATASLQLGAIVQRRAAEEELLAIGKEYRNALQSYANLTPIGQKRYPPSLAELLKDPRFPQNVRHLRKIYADPLSGKEEWGIVRPVEGQGVLAVYSLAEAKPIKIGNFDAEWRGFENSQSYQDWRFGIAVNTVVKADSNAEKTPSNTGATTAKSVVGSTLESSGTVMSQEERNQINQQDGIRPYEQP